jgi:carotenoid cleavage dioxygenase-like enzyme
MIHGIRIKDGKAFYCNRYTQTDRLKAETKQGGPIYIRIGEFFNTSGLAKMLLLDLERKVGYIEGGDVLNNRNGTANTAFTNHSNHTYALEESCFPYQISVDKNSKE